MTDAIAYQAKSEAISYYNIDEIATPITAHGNMLETGIEW